MEARLHALDYLVIFAYMALVAGIGLYMSRRQKTTADYFIASRRVPAWAVAFTLMGTMISSVSFVAQPGAVFGRNLYLLIAHLAVPFVLIFVVLFIVPFYRRVIGMSAYEYLDQRFGGVSRVYASLGFVVLRMLDLGFTIFTTAIAASVMSGWPILTIIIVLGAFTTIYTMIGGIEGVIWTDVFQGFILIGGAALILLTLLFGTDVGPIGLIQTAAAGGKLSLGDWEFSARSLYFETPTAWIFFLSGLLNFGRSYVCEQNMVQRYLVAQTDRDAQRATLFGALSCVPIWLTFMFIGAALWAFYQVEGIALPPDVTSHPDNILPYYVLTQLPTGVVGLILAAILAAAQSTVSADLNSVSTVLTSDYFRKFRPQASDRRQLLFGRSAVLVGGTIFTVIGLLLSQTRAMAALETGVTLVSIIAGGILGLFALGFLIPHASSRAALAGIVVCLLFTTWATITGPLHGKLGLDIAVRFTMHPILIGVFSHFILFGVGLLASIAWPGDPVANRRLTIWHDHSEKTALAQAPRVGKIAQGDVIPG